MTVPIIALLTDFGGSDVYVGVMKGVILSIAPETQLVDLTHEVDAHDIREAAFLLNTAAPYFPEDTIFLAVVDPGVGPSRKGLIAQVGRRTVVGPDNGLFSFFWLQYPEASVHELDSAEYRLPSPSDTFHGRDIFAPAAAWASRGTPPARFGPRILHPVSIPLPRPIRSRDRVEAEIIHVDRFGNLVSNLDWGWLEKEGILIGSEWVVHIGDHRITDRVETYHQAASNTPVALRGSSGFLEISVREANAARLLGAGKGSSILVVREV